MTLASTTVDALRPPQKVSRRRGGFTLLEVTVVLVLVGILFSFMLPKLGGLTPRYRLRSYAREIAGVIEEMRVNAIARGKSMGIRYVLDSTQPTVERVPPAPPEFPDQPLADRETLVRLEPPPGVRIRGVLLPGTRGGLITSGVVNIGFSPNGTTGSHIVILEGDDSQGGVLILSLKYNSISGVLDYFNHDVDFQHHES